MADLLTFVRSTAIAKAAFAYTNMLASIAAQLDGLFASARFHSHKDSTNILNQKLRQAQPESATGVPQFTPSEHGFVLVEDATTTKRLLLAENVEGLSTMKAVNTWDTLGLNAVVCSVTLSLPGAGPTELVQVSVSNHENVSLVPLILSEITQSVFTGKLHPCSPIPLSALATNCNMLPLLTRGMTVLSVTGGDVKDHELTSSLSHERLKARLKDLDNLMVKFMGIRERREGSATATGTPTVLRLNGNKTQWVSQWTPKRNQGWLRLNVDSPLFTVANSHTATGGEPCEAISMEGDPVAGGSTGGELEVNRLCHLYGISEVIAVMEIYGEVWTTLYKDSRDSDKPIVPSWDQLDLMSKAVRSLKMRLCQVTYHLMEGGEQQLIPQKVLFEHQSEWARRQ